MMLFLTFVINTIVISKAVDEDSMNIDKVIIPAAGRGTRFLPVTKSIPKEMLPILNKPAIQYIVEEGLESNIQHFCIITNEEKQSIKHYFSPHAYLDSVLKPDRRKLLASVDIILEKAYFTYINQEKPLGNGHAILLARDVIGDEFFGVCFPDDIIIADDPALGQLITIARQEKVSVLAVQEVPEDRVSSYGIVAVKKQLSPNLFEIDHLVEKPNAKDAPSNLAIIGRYVLSPKIFDSLEAVPPHANGELQLTDAMEHMIHHTNEKIYAYKVQGTRYDTGVPQGWLQAIIDIALHDAQFAKHTPCKPSDE